MGRKAKLKKLRHSAQPQPSPQSQPQNDDPTEFVRQIEGQGYHLQQMMSSPDIPQVRQTSQAKPQV